MSRWWTPCGALLLAVVVAACGGRREQQVADAGAAAAAPHEGSGAGPSAAADTRPPLFGGLTAHHAVGWGRVRFEWRAAVDNGSPAARIVYRLEGRAPQSPQAEPVVVTSQPGATALTVTADARYTSWSIVAIDEAGNVSTPAEPTLVRTVPELLQVGTDAIQGALRDCAHESSGLLACGGENGRFATWQDGRWHEAHLDVSEPVGVTLTPSGVIELSTALDRYHLNGEGAAVAVSRAFESAPSYPLRAFVFEPSGLAEWLDGDGHVWASNGGAFRRLDDPFLLGSDGRCAHVTDLLYRGDRGFARCASGTQLLLRAESHGYRWSALPDAQGLPANLAVRQVVFGEGRQISLLDGDGRVWRYDLGGWHTLYPTDPSYAPATALTPADEARLVRIAAGTQVVALDPLGVREPLASPAVRSPLVFLEAPDRGSLAVTAWGEVVDLARGQVLHAAAPSGFSQVVRQGDSVVGLVADQPAVGLYMQYDQGWTHEPRPALAVPDGALLRVRKLESGDLLLALDRGAAGGQIARLGAQDLHAETFLYPPPPPPPGGSLSVRRGEPPPPAPPEGSGEVVDPALLLVGVPASTLNPAPPPPPPIRDVALDAATHTGVAAGEGGSLWLWIEGGWLRIDPALPMPVPLTAVRITGDHRYLVGGVDGLLLTCEWATCQAEQLPVGDVRAFRPMGDSLWLLGSRGVARQTADGSWEPLALAFQPPYPGASAPTALLGAAQQGDTQWLLADDGSIWRSAEDGFDAVGRVQAPLDLWVDARGTVFVATHDALYRL